MWCKGGALFGCLVDEDTGDGGARGVRLKLKLPKVASYDERLGWQRENRRRFSVMSHCGNSLSHSWIGKFGSSVAIHARK